MEIIPYTDSERLEKKLRARLQQHRDLLDGGKGEWGHPDYVTDSTWHAWLYIVATLEDILAAAGDGKK